MKSLLTDAPGLTARARPRLRDALFFICFRRRGPTLRRLKERAHALRSRTADPSRPVEALRTADELCARRPRSQSGESSITSTFVL